MDKKEDGLMMELSGLVQLVNARIVDVENGTYYPPQVSLVHQDGKIVAMPGLPGEPEQVQADAIIDLGNRAVIPGLFNTHCHLHFLPKNEIINQQIIKNLSDCINRGITNIRDTLVYDLQISRAWKEKINHREILGPRIHQAIHVSPLGGTYAPRRTLSTQFSFSLLGLKVLDYQSKTSGVVVFRPDARAQEIRDAVDRAIDERGAEAIKFCDQPEHFMTYKPGAKVMTVEQLTTAADQATRRGIATTMHTVTVEGFRNGIRTGVGSLAHLPLNGILNDADAKLLLDSHTFIEPTLSVGYFMSYRMKGSPFTSNQELQRLDPFREQSYQGVIKEFWLPQLQESRMALHKALSKGEMKIYGIIDISVPFTYYSKMIPNGGENLRILAKNGGIDRMACGNDAGPTNATPASIGHELILFDFLLNREESPRINAVELLKIATIQSAQALKMDQQFGSIRPGKVADLVVMDGDPLTDFHLIGQPADAVFMDGNLVINRCGLKAAQSVQE